MESSQRPRGALSAVILRLVREPFAQFLFIGGLIFAGSQAVAMIKDHSAHRIVIDNTVEHRIAALYENQMGVPPSPVQLKALTANYIKSEVLYREALRLGLDRNDEIIKRRLVQKMSFLNADNAAATPVSEADLKNYYDAHKSDFAVPATVTFNHIFFSADDPNAKEHIEHAIAVLKSNPDATELGDIFPLESDYSALTRRSAQQIFGDTPIVGGLFSAPTGSWQGPFRSGYGWHLIYVTGHTDRVVPPLKDVRKDVENAAQAAASKGAAEQAYAAMKAKYTVIRSDNPRNPDDLAPKVASVEPESHP